MLIGHISRSGAYLWLHLSAVIGSILSTTPISPEIYSDGPTVLKCRSYQPITWFISFDPKFQVNNSGVLPYQIQSEYKLCNRTTNLAAEEPTNKRCFESAVKFITSISNRFKKLSFLCSSTIHNQTLKASWATNVSGMINLTQEYVEFLLLIVEPLLEASIQGFYGNYQSSFGGPTSTKKEVCQNVTPVPKSSGSKYGCFHNNNSKSNNNPVNYLNCSNWENCQQLASHKFREQGRRICQETWDGKYCNLNPGFCEKFNNDTIFNDSGIVYCKENGELYLLPFFKTADENKTTLHLITDVKRHGMQLVQLKPLLRYNKELKQYLNQKKFAFKCTAPKFLALKGFEWNGVYDRKPTNFSGDCQMIERVDTTTTYIEECRFEIPWNFSRNRINVSCTVYLQSGETITEYSDQNYPFSNNQTTLTPDSDITTGVIWGISLSLMVLLPILIYGYCKIRRQKKKSHFPPKEVEAFMRGSIRLSLLGQSINPQSATVLPYDVSLEIPREKIKFEPIILGEGAFGKVIKGHIERRPVAIKTSKKTEDGQYFRALLSELKIMSFVGKHSNIVDLLGANTERIKKQEVYLIFEFCENGNVLDFIRKRREQFVDQLIPRENSDEVLHKIDSITFQNNIVQYENGISKKMCSEDLIRWSLEIATGMDFIAAKKVYHGDLAARNILLSQRLVAKVGDFGLAKELKNYDLYVQRLECPLPLKWMSIEALRDLEFSIQSDVWSYGITLWEIFSLGCIPYPGVEWNFQAWRMLEDGQRMDRPPHANESIYDILLKCWQAETSDRPTFAELKIMLAEELEKIVDVRF